MHHRPAGLPRSARKSGALTRGLVRTRRSARRGGARLGLGMALSTVVTGFVLAVPVVSSGSPTSTMSQDASSSSAARFAEGSSPVVMGRDGAPAPTSAADTPAAPPATEVPTASAEVPVTAEVPSATSETAPENATDTPAPSSSPSSAPATSPSSAPSSAASSAPQATAAATAAAAPASGAEAEVIALVNSVRADAGCAPVVHDEGLAQVARAHSADMRDQDFFDHENLAGLDPFDRAEAAGQTNARAENIAYGQPDAAAVMEDWMDSRGHRANILDCELRTLGVGVAEGPGGPWWTQLFGD